MCGHARKEKGPQGKTLRAFLLRSLRDQGSRLIL
jgi:hypothetical protein